jgi:hypothetical protein
MTETQAIARAKRLARERGVVMAVVKMDAGPGREIRVVRDEYTYGPEFEAFRGVLLFEVHPCGDIN